MIILNRRGFLKRGCDALAMAAFARSLGMLNFATTASAQTATDYKALVCIFMFGGNDANNMIIPHEQAEYDAYAAVRTPASGINIARDTLLQIRPPSLNKQLGFHPSMPHLHRLWNRGNVAIVSNVGTLVEPLTRAQYLAGTGLKPASLFSHSDQQNQWQASISEGLPGTGWGGRMADVTWPQNGGVNFPMVLSVAGNNLFATSAAHEMLNVPSTGTFGLRGFGTSTAQMARYNAMQTLLTQDADKTLVARSAATIDQAIDYSTVIDPIVNSTTSTIERMFAKQSASLSRQLLRVAKIIERRETLGLKRQIFFCSIGGFDTHNGQATAQASLLQQLSLGMKTFYDATEKLGVASRVTTFTLSDFGRTLQPAAGAGTDHAWGSHQLVMGGSVRGGDVYGAWPTLALGGPDDSGSEGRWIPTTAVDQYAATIAQWYGVSTADLPTVLPNLNRFATSDLGFFVIE
jgi:uncharacterized protein (DUF1501 family)